VSEPWRTRGIRFWPILVLALLAVVFVFMLLFSRKAPVISSLEPSMAAPGQQVVVTGDYFGRTEREGSLSVAGEIPPPSLIKSWSDQRIVLTIPEDAASGLVIVSNSQGTSTGVLFTNTDTIPTVLQVAAGPSKPLLWAIAPAQPSPGQTVTISGRGFGLGDEAVVVRVANPASGPVFEVGPAESLAWSEGSVTLRWPSGAAEGAVVTVATPRGESPPFTAGGPGPVVWESPRKITVEVRVTVAQPEATSVTIWAPVPQRSTGTAWSLVSADPPPREGRSPSFFWPAGSAGERQAFYRLALTSWVRRWTGLVGSVPASQDLPQGDETPRTLWKPAAVALKNLVAKWGLETPDPWLRLQRLQTGLAGYFPAAVRPGEKPALTRPPVELLTPGKMTSYEISTLAAYLASQSGLPARLVEGLWLKEGALFPRTWTEVWMAGAGWVSWDVIDGTPGTLDNKHFGFEAGSSAPFRRQPRSKTFGPAAPGSLVNASGEATGPGPEPVAQWQVTWWEK